VPTLPLYNVEIFDSKFFCSSSRPYSYISLCNSTATLRQCDRQRDAFFHRTPSVPSHNIFPSYRNNCFVSSFMNSSGIRYKKTANVALRDVARKLYQGVLYFQHVTVLHGTRASAILRVLKKLRPYFRSFSRNSQRVNNVICIYIYIYIYTHTHICGPQTSSSRIM